MYSLRLTNNRGFRWVADENSYVKGFAFYKNRLYRDDTFLGLISQVKNLVEFRNLIAELNGSFAVVLIREDELFAAVDRVRSIPLFYVKEGHSITIVDHLATSDSVHSFVGKELAREEFLLTGYTVGNRTLLENAFQLEAGQIGRLSGESFNVEFYYRHYHTSHTIEQTYDSLERISRNIGQRLMESCGGRQIVVPLSGGYDSRYIVALLKKSGYKNVVCYTYGKEDSFEVEVSKKVATTLGFEWYFIPYNEKKWRKYIEDDAWMRFASNYSSLPHCQEYIAIEELLNTGLIAEDAIIVPGFCGDFLGGSYLPDEFTSGTESKLLNKGIAEYILENHYHLDWPVEQRELLLEAIKENLSNSEPSTVQEFVSMNEEFFTRGKIAKFVLNSLRVYEYFGLEWRLPLWDNELTEFWYGVDLQKKINKSLYDGFLLDCLFLELNISFRKQGPVAIQQKIKNNAALRFFVQRFRPQLRMLWRRVLRADKYKDFNTFGVLYNVILEQGRPLAHVPSPDNINSIYAWYCLTKLSR